MAQPKRFSAEEFKTQLNDIIDLLITHKRQLPEAERTDIRVEEIAASFGVNSATLRRWCQEYLQMKPKHYLVEYRMEKAKVLLLQGGKPSVIFIMLAFTEHKTFSIAFKRYQGVTPSDYVKSKN